MVFTYGKRCCQAKVAILISSTVKILIGWNVIVALEVPVQVENSSKVTELRQKVFDISNLKNMNQMDLEKLNVELQSIREHLSIEKFKKYEENLDTSIVKFAEGRNTVQYHEILQKIYLTIKDEIDFGKLNARFKNVQDRNQGLFNHAHHLPIKTATNVQNYLKLTRELKITQPCDDLNPKMDPVSKVKNGLFNSRVFITEHVGENGKVNVKVIVDYAAISKKLAADCTFMPSTFSVYI